MERIAIIGMGISGSAVLTAYAKELTAITKESYHIDCYDLSHSFGRGLPFRKDSDYALLNTRSKDITYDYELRGDYGKWLEANDYKGQEVPEYTSRQLYGDYLHEKTMENISKIGANIYNDEIHDIHWQADTKTWLLTGGHGASKQYDRVHLCCGTLPQHDPYHLAPYSNYISNPYPLDDFPTVINEQQRVVIIGTSLTAVDILKYLAKERHVESIYVFSRNNHFPTVGLKDAMDLEMTKLTLERVWQLTKENDYHLSFEQFNQLIEEELESMSVNYDVFCKNILSDGMLGMRHSLDEPDLVAKMERLATVASRILNGVWQYMPEMDRKKFRSKYHEVFNLVKGKLPLQSAKVLIDSEDSGQLTVLEDVSDIQYDYESAEFILVNTDGVERVRADWVINATGLNDQLQLGNTNNPVLESLLNKRYITADTAGGLSINVSNQTVLSPTWGEFETLHAHGTLISGSIYMNNSTYVMQSFAHKLVQRLLK